MIQNLVKVSQQVPCIANALNRLQCNIGPQPGYPILIKQLKVQGFMAQRWFVEWPKAFKVLDGWIKEVRRVD